MKYTKTTFNVIMWKHLYAIVIKKRMQARAQNNFSGTRKGMTQQPAPKI